MIKALFEMTEEQEAMASMVSQIMAYILIVLGLIMLLLMTIAACQVKKEQEQYIKKLDEHDKSIILDYKNLNRYLPRRKKKQNEKYGGRTNISPIVVVGFYLS